MTIKLWDLMRKRLISSMPQNQIVTTLSRFNKSEYMISVGLSGLVSIFNPESIPKDRLELFVSDKYNLWQVKDEFEKTSGYNIRMSQKESVIQKFMIEALNDLGAWEETTIGKYDSENEVFLISTGFFGELLIAVPISNARQFKEEFNEAQFYPTFDKKETNWVLTELEVKVPGIKEGFIYSSDKWLSYTPIALTEGGESIKLNLNLEQNDFIPVDEQKYDDYDIERDLPQSSVQNPDAIAVVIGNSKYLKTKPVLYAGNDARLMKKYLVDAMGYREGNIFLLNNITKGDFETFFGTKDNHNGKLFNSVRENLSDVFIYYSGHGAPGLKDNNGYFVPVECDPMYIELGGYSLQVFYDNISKIPSRKTTVVIDACFSGATVFDNISPVYISIKNPIVQINNCTVLSSSTGSQVSSWFNEKRHGMFTYFFLKAIHNKNADINADNRVSMDEIYEYISNKSFGIPYFARRIHGVEQDPVIQGDTKNILVEY